MKTLVLLIAITCAGCLRSTTFKCDENTDCVGAGPQSQCESDGFCTFSDSSCTSGRRYAESSGAKSSQCVGETTGEDAGTEPMPGGEPPMSNCPASGYAMLPNAGPRGHMYKLLDAPMTWSQQRDLCAGEGTYLAFPDGASVADAQLELAALRTLAGDAAWVGINDIATEGQYRTSLNQPASTVTVMLISITGNPQQTDCFVINNTSLDDADCSTTRKAVCECVP